MTFPSAFESVLLALAAWRVWQLCANDDITEPVRRYVTRLPQDFQEGERFPPGFRYRTADFIECPYCLGFWVAVGWAGFYAVWPAGAVWAALPFALNAGVVVVNHWLTSD